MNQTFQAASARTGETNDECRISYLPFTPARRAALAQFSAYNKGDIDAFAAAYSEDIQLIDLETGTIFCSGKSALIERYGKLFSENPTLRCDLIKRTSFGKNIVYDEERVIGHPTGDVVHAMATYFVNDQGLIYKVLFSKEVEVKHASLVNKLT